MVEPLEIKQVTKKETWEQFVTTRAEANFLSSWAWGQFQLQMDRTVFYLGLYSQNKLVGVCLAVKEAAKRGPYLTVIGGPLIEWEDEKLVVTLFEYLKSLAKDQGCWFIRIRPQIVETTSNLEMIAQLGFIKAPMHATADLTLQLDISESEESLLAQMRKNTRYEIKKAEKLHISVKQSKDVNDLETFYQQQLLLAKQHHFVPFSLKFFEEQFKAFLADDNVLLLHAYQDTTLLSSAFVIFYGSEAVYHYGVSTPANHRLPGTHAALWAAIKEAKKRQIKRFNFWGIAPSDNPKHRFWGVRVFKTGFGGEEVAYIPAHDLPVSPFYWLTYSFESYRAKVRHLA